MKTIFLAAPGLRARAYLQRMLAEQFVPELVVLLGAPEDDQVDARAVRGFAKSFQPGERLRSTIARHGLKVAHCETRDVNDPEVVACIAEQDADLVVFSGGGIAKPPLLRAARRLLHVHPGPLPQMRGSTCHHHALLLHGRIFATAFFLSEGIDEGRTLASESFIPPEELSPFDLDHGYEAWMRSTVLLSALARLRRHPDDPGDAQCGEGRMYYVIHPVLKHLAILRALPSARREAAQT